MKKMDYGNTRHCDARVINRMWFQHRVISAFDQSTGVMTTLIARAADAF